MTRRRRAAIFGVLLLVVGCKLDRSIPENASDSVRTRSEERRVELPSEPAALAATLGVPRDSLHSAAEERYQRQAYDTARAIWEVEVRRALADHDKPAEATARMWIGLASWRLGDYKTARVEGETSLAMKRALSMDSELSRSFNALGLLAWNEGRHRDALRLFDSAVVTARRNNDKAGLARASANIPLVQVELGEFDEARNGLLGALSAAKELRDERTVGNSLTNLAMLDIKLGRASSALRLLDDARRHYSLLNYSTGQENALEQLATAYAEVGDLQRAIAAADSGLAIARAAGLEQQVAAALEVLADLHAQAGNPRLALRRLLEADSVDAALGLAVERGTNLRRISTILLDIGEADAATARAREALAGHLKVDAHAEAVLDRLQLAQSLLATKAVAAARAEADSASNEAAKTGNESMIREAAVVSAQLALSSSDPRSAYARLRSIDSASASNDWRIPDLRAQALFAIGQTAHARAEAQWSIRILERERASLGAGPLRSSYLSNRVGPYSRLVRIHLALGDTAAAFAVASSLAGRGLVERLGESEKPGGAIGDVAESERLLRIAAALEKELDDVADDAKDAERKNSLQKALEATRAAYEERLSAVANSPSAQMLGLSSTRQSVVQANLGAGDAALVFLSGPDRLDEFLVRDNQIHYAGVPIGDRQLASRVRATRDLLGRNVRSSESLAALADLNDLILGPFRARNALEGIGHLLLVPHASLGALPFAALWDRNRSQFLIEQMPISYLPSTSALTIPSRAQKIGRGGIVVFAPLPDSLPETRTEARQIAAIVPGSRLLFGAVSTESRVRSALNAGDVVHVASHGSHNAQNPLFSRVIVGRSRSDSSNNDGRLEVHEILGLRTTSPLVFLSGCETGLGTVGEGLLSQGSDEGSLAQAFLVAGAENVVATLWRVSDVGAAHIAESFYRHSRAGLSIEDALTAAQREGIHSEPGFTWASYALYSVGGRKSSYGVRTTIPDPLLRGR